MLPKIVGLVGPIRSGKTTVSSYLVERHGYRLASNSAILKEIAENLMLTPDRENLKRLGDAIFSSLGNDAIARFRLSQNSHFPIVVDGIRYQEEIAVYRQEPTFKLIGLDAEEKVRYDRAITLAHEGKDQIMTRDAFQSLASARSEKTVPSILREADLSIRNDSGLEQLKRDIDSAIARWSLK